MRLCEEFGSPGDIGDPVPAFPGKECKEFFFGGIDDLLGRHEFRQYCSRCSAIDIAEGPVVPLKELEFAELQVKVGDHIGLLPGDAFCKVHAVPCQALQGDILAAAPGLQLFGTTDPCKVRNEESVRWVCLFHPNIGLAVVGGGLWVHAEDTRLIRHKYLTCGEEAGDMDAINGSSFQGNDDGDKVAVLLHTLCNHGGQLICARLVVAEGR